MLCFLEPQLDPAAKWLAQSIGVNTFDNSHLRLELGRIVEELIDTAGIIDPPVSFADLRRIGELRHVRRVSLISMNCGGALLPVHGGFTVHLESSQSELRLRTSLAHEIGHTFFYDLDSETPLLRFKRGSSRSAIEEGLAWEIARALLAPRRIISAWLKDRKNWPNIKTFVDLKKRFDLSPELLVRRLQDLATFDSDYSWNGIIYRISPAEKKQNGESLSIIGWKFGELSKLTAYSKRAAKNVRLVELVELMKSRPEDIHEFDELIVRGAIGEIPTGRYHVGCTWADAMRTQLLIMMNPLLAT